MKLKDKVAIVTGGGTGIGKGISRSLAEAGARVVIAQTRGEKAEETARELQAEGHEILPLSVDIRLRPRVQELMSRTIDRWGQIDILVNNAAVTGARAAAPFLDLTDEFLDETVDVNLKGTFICSQEAARRMLGRGGAIINISSVGAFAAQEGATAYCATKAGLVGLTKAMALELAPHGIRVNCVAPGDIQTEANENIIDDIKKRGIKGRYFRPIPLGRRGRPADIGPTIVFLASDDSAYIVGETIVVDGGFLTY
ncbi:MAG: SDR family oxidoreductase [Acidobacteriota bacterium]|nr:SDR family oxidoreductase [Acidobacteriota bacterium]